MISRYPRWFLVSLLMVLVLTLSACETDGAILEPETVGEEEVVVVEEPAVTVEAPADADVVVTHLGFTGVEGNFMMLTSDLLDREVENAQDEQLGYVEDFYFDLETGNVLFVLVEYGGLLDLGETQVPVPMTALALGLEMDELMSDVPEEVFRDLPELDIDESWPVGLDATWDDELIHFWEQAGFVVDRARYEAVNPNLVASAQDMAGYGVGYAEVASTATSDELVVDIGEGRVKYALLTFFETGPYGQDWVVVPWEAYDPAVVGDELVFDPVLDEQLMVTAPRLSPDELGGADVLAPNWDDEIARFWAEHEYDPN